MHCGGIQEAHQYRKFSADSFLTIMLTYEKKNAQFYCTSSEIDLSVFMRICDHS